MFVWLSVCELWISWKWTPKQCQLTQRACHYTKKGHIQHTNSFYGYVAFLHWHELKLIPNSLLQEQNIRVFVFLFILEVDMTFPPQREFCWTICQGLFVRWLNTKLLYMRLLRYVHFLKRKSKYHDCFNRAVTVCSVNILPQQKSCISMCWILSSVILVLM